MVQANIDKILDYLKIKKSASVAELSKSLNIPSDDVQKSLEYLEEEGKIKLDYGLTSPKAMLIEKKESKISSQSLPQEKKEEKIDLPKNVFDMPLVKKQDKAISVPDFSNLAPKMEQIEKNPLEDKPWFDLSTPPPADSFNLTKTTAKEQTQPVSIAKQHFLDSNITPFSSIKEENIPSYVKSDLDKIEYLIDKINNKILDHDYSNLNSLYRKAYNLFHDSDELSHNERLILKEKLNDVFNRIKRIYLIEGVA